MTDFIKLSKNEGKTKVNNKIQDEMEDGLIKELDFDRKAAIERQQY